MGFKSRKFEQKLHSINSYAELLTGERVQFPEKEVL